jgi:outer membrane protein
MATVQAYFDTLTAQAVHRARVEASRLAGETLAAAQRRETGGATGRNDTLQAKTALARAQLAEQRASGEARKTMATLVYTLGISADIALTLPQDNLAPARQIIADLEEWLTMAKATHPAIIAAQKQWEASQSKVSSIRAQGLPTIDFGTSFFQNGYPNQSIQATRSNTTIVGVTLNIPLFEGFARTYRIHEAHAQAEQSKAHMEDVEREVLGDMVKAHANAVSAVDGLDAASMLLESAQMTWVSSRNRYVHGVADILEVLNAQSALVEAQQERVRTESDWRSARLRLRAAAGVLGRQRATQIDLP